jgi:hypothetical protein
VTKSIVLLAKSRKYHNYCVAGIDTETGEWVRLISEDRSIHNAVPPEDLTYEDGTEAAILDIVNVEIKDHSPNYYQPENYTYDSGYYWEKIGESTVDEVLDVINQIDDDYIFYNNEKKLPRSFVEQIDAEIRYSLKLIIPENVRLNVKQWNINGPLSYSLCFDYNDDSYAFLKITDDNFTHEYQEEGWYNLENVALVASLADLYDADNCHYKLIATIML